MLMATFVTISPAEYLATDFVDREPEYVRGELRERPLPDRYHARLQSILIGLLNASGGPRGYEALAEVRCQLAEDVFRLPDVSLFPLEPFQNLPSAPPLLVIEVVSKNDRYVGLLQKLDEYLVWGVSNIWVVDPWRRRLGVYRSSGLENVAALALGELNLEMKLTDLAYGLPELPS
ncbi:MAG: Uma2 family endonuclease [Bryobacteraceae bacterium]|nr:Uma2 family endonuclease [Bryobacteraceae bacterium]